MSSLPVEVETVVPQPLPPFDAAYQEFKRRERWQGYEAAQKWLEASSLPERGKELVKQRVIRENLNKIRVEPAALGYLGTPRKELGL